MPLRHRLLAPACERTLAEMTENWHRAVIQARCTAGGFLAADPRIPSRVRGALGRQLAESASAEALAGKPCLWSPPCLLDMLFGNRGKTAEGLEIPKPYRVSVQANGEALLVEVVLFGFVADLAEGVAETLVRALRCGLNRSDSNHPDYLPLEVCQRSVTTETGVLLPPPAEQAMLFIEMQTPLCIRSSGQLRQADFGSLVSSVASRVRGMARWQDSELVADWPDIVNAARSLKQHRLPAARAVSWQRGSTRQNASIDIEGFMDRWLVDSPSPELLMLLALGSTTGAGSRTSLGLGQYQFGLLPQHPA